MVIQVQLGSTGLRVSRVCLGMMSFGKHPDREWTLDESEAEPIVRAALLLVGSAALVPIPYSAASQSSPVR